MSILYPGDSGYEEALERGAQREIDILEQQLRVERSAAEVQQRRAESAESQRDHARRMVEAAITHFVESADCPPDGHKACRALVTSMTDQPAEPPLEFCIQCIRDYLDAKAKEGERHD